MRTNDEKSQVINEILPSVTSILHDTGTSLAQLSVPFAVPLDEVANKLGATRVEIDGAFTTNSVFVGLRITW